MREGKGQDEEGKRQDVSLTVLHMAGLNQTVLGCSLPCVRLIILTSPSSLLHSSSCWNIKYLYKAHVFQVLLVDFQSTVAFIIYINAACKEVLAALIIPAQAGSGVYLLLYNIHSPFSLQTIRTICTRCHSSFVEFGGQTLPNEAFQYYIDCFI